MIDARWQKLADVLVNHSVRVQPGERVLIEAFDMPPEFVALLMRTVHAAGGEAIPLIKQTPVLRALYQNASEEQIKFRCACRKRAGSCCAGPPMAWRKPPT
jgi:aminopeptidase